MRRSIFGLKLPPEIEAEMKQGQFSIVPLGGFGEIGKNCMVWRTPAASVVVDCGLMFPSDYHLGVDVLIPDFSYIREKSDHIQGVVLTHGHEDHIGGLPWLMPHLQHVPIYGTSFTLALVEHKLRERGLLDKCRLVEVSDKEPVVFGDMVFHFIPVCHSIIDGVALCVETPIGKVIHTGDFKIDPQPIEGAGTDLSLFSAFAGEDGVQLLLSDSTNVEVEEAGVNERDVLSSLEHIFTESAGRIIITLFSSHILRIQEVLDCAQATGRTVIVSGRSLQNNIEMARKLGRLRVPGRLVYDGEELPNIPDSEQVLLVTGSQGEPLSALSRIVNGMHRTLSIHAGDVVIMSSRTIPGNAMAVNTLINNIYRVGAEVYHDKEHAVHASGHAGRDDLAAMIAAVRPHHFIPVHGEYRHLVKHARLAVAGGVAPENAHIVENGMPVTLTKGTFAFGEPVQASAVMVDGKGVGDVGQVILKERRLLGGEGLVVVVMVLDQATWSILHGPQLFSKGFAFEQQYSYVLQDAQCLVLDAVESLPPGELEKLQEEVRSSLRRFFRKVLDRDPIVVPVITAV